MTMCLCDTVHALVEKFDEDQALSLIPTLNDHLRDLQALLAQSKSLARGVQYRFISNNQRTLKALFVDSINIEPVDRIYERFRDDANGFWTSSYDVVHVELRRRLASIIVFLTSKINAELSVSPEISELFQGQQNYAELRNSGRKYIKIARKLGGLGSILWLPLDIPPSTYERYLNIDDDEVFQHLSSLRPQVGNYADFAQYLIVNQLCASSKSFSYFNLFSEFSDIIPASEQLLLLCYGLGSFNIPDVILTSIHHQQRRWNSDGEIESISPLQFGLPVGIVSTLLDDAAFSRAVASSYITKHALEDGTATWSLSTDIVTLLSETLKSQTVDDLAAMALKLICYACPPCYEGNTTWSPSLKKAVWHMLEKLTTKTKMQLSQRPQVLEATLYFCERDSVAIRSTAVDQSRGLLRKSMPYYLHASVALFQSVLYRLSGELAKSEAQIRDFQWRGPNPLTRRDHALEGRLHISQIENKIKCYDNDVPSFIYKWKAEQPLSTLDIEVTFRLQSAAARFFQSIGDFAAARASLEQFLSLNTTNPIRDGTRRIIIGRLADIYCEMNEFEKANTLLLPELESIDEKERLRRPFRRLLLASIEANIGLHSLDAAESVLNELEDAVPFEMEDIYDQQLHIRRLLAVARIAHMKADRVAAVRRWRFALQEVERMHTLKSKTGFTAAMIYFSMAHAQLTNGDRDGGRNSWVSGTEILRREKCEFWIPIVPTVWLQKIFVEVHDLQGWSVRMMLPGGRPDITLP